MSGGLKLGASSNEIPLTEKLIEHKTYLHALPYFDRLD